MTDSTSHLATALAGGNFVVTAELAPPVATDPAAFIARALPLKGVATAVNVTDGAGAKAHVSSLAAAYFLLQNGIEPVLQMTCRDRNRLALQGDLLGAIALGMRNLLVLSGDDPKLGDQPEAKPVFDYNSQALLAVANAMRRDHRLPPGTEIKGPTDLFLGAADLPIDPPPDWNPKIPHRQGRGRRRFRADAVLHACRDRAALCRAVGRSGHRAQAQGAARRGAHSLGALGAVDEGKALRHDHPRRDRRSAGQGR